MEEERTYNYFCFGQKIRSDFEFPEMNGLPVCASNTSPDIEIEITDGLFSSPTPSAEPTIDFSQGDQFFDFFNVIQARISNAEKVSIAPYEGFDPAMIGLPILGPVMATLLHYRGLLVLHASSIVIDNKLVAFVGHRGAGKSTTAACLLSLGYKLFSDDLLIIDPLDGFCALAGYPATKMMSDTQAAFSIKRAVPLSNGRISYPKVRLRLEDNQVPAKMPISHIFNLQRSNRAQLSALGPKEMIDTFMQNTYMLKYGQAAFSSERMATHFIQCSELSNLTSVSTLETPSVLNKLPQIEDVIRSALSRVS